MPQPEPSWDLRLSSSHAMGAEWPNSFAVKADVERLILRRIAWVSALRPGTNWFARISFSACKVKRSHVVVNAWICTIVFYLFATFVSKIPVGYSFFAAWHCRLLHVIHASPKNFCECFMHSVRRQKTASFFRIIAIIIFFNASGLFTVFPIN